MSNTDSSEEENLELFKEAADLELFNNNLYKSNTDSKVQQQKSLRISNSDDQEFNNLFKISTGAQTFIAKELENYLNKTITYKLSNSDCVKYKCQKSKIKLFSDSKHYIDIKKDINGIKPVKRVLKNCEFTSEDERNVNSVLIDSKNIGKETENWQKSTRTKHIFRYKKSKTGKTLIQI